MLLKFKVVILVLVFLLAGVWLLAQPLPVSADGPIYVDADSAGPTHDGLSWTTAYTNVQDALAVANAGGATDYEIWVAEGVYYPDDGIGHVSDAVTETFALRHDNVRLYGGFDPSSGVDTWEERDWETYPTVLSGDIAQDDTTDPHGVVTTTAHISGTNAYHVLWLDGVTNEPISTTTVIDGFTITAGQANGTAPPHYSGGGLTCDGSGNACSPTLAHLAFRGNYAQASNNQYNGVGGGMYNNAGNGGTSSPILADVTFSGNWGSTGGGMYNYGGDNGVSNPTLTNVTFSDNLAGNGYGGGMVNAGISGTSSPVLSDVTFIDNYAASDGGGMVNGGYYDGGTSTPVLTRVSFIGNQAVSSGGGMANVGVIGGTSSPVLTDVAFHGNWTNGNGGGMHSYLYDSGTSSPVLTNVTFSGNWASDYGGGMVNFGAFGGTCSPVLTNVILWGNSGSQMYNIYASPTLKYSLVQDGCPTDANCDAYLLTSDPQFVAPISATSAPTTTGDYRLRGSSPAIDAGNTLSVTVPTDLVGNLRLRDGDGDDTATVDMGAYEYQVLYVDAEASGADDGTSWTNAYVHLQDALDETHANDATDFEIWVAEGVYYPDEDSDGDHVSDAVTETFTLSYDNVQLYGGFDPDGGAGTWAARDWESYSTVLSGDIAQDDTTDPHGVVTTTAHISGTNAYHVLWLDGVSHEPISTTTVIDGFTITAGQANGTADPHYLGGGLTCDGSGGGNACSPTLAHLAFRGNYAQSSASAFDGGGGGMYNNAGFSGTSSPLLTDVTFNGNQSAYGGGMFNDGSYSGASSPTLIDVTFSDNHATSQGGGMHNANYMGNSSPTLTNVTFSNNQADSAGGGMYNYTQDGISSPVLTNVTFSGNRADFRGGGIYNHGNNGASSPRLTNVIFKGNQASEGGGMYSEGLREGNSSPALTNVTFSGNQASSGAGGGMYNYTLLDGTSSPTLTNVTLSGNQANQGGGMYNDGSGGTSRPSLTNVIIWGNGAPTGMVMVNNVATPTIAYSLIEGGAVSPGIYNNGGSVIDGGGIITGTPQFVHPIAATAAPTTTGDYRLIGTSPAIDAADNAAITVTTDLDGNPRFFDHPRVDSGSGTPPIVDMGAYETPDTPPQADAGGPYSGDEGISIALAGSASSDIDTDDFLFYEWDCTADGIYDTASYTATDSLCTYPQDGAYTLRLRVTDSLSATGTATATVAVDNVAPLAADDAYTMTEDIVRTVTAPGLLLNDSDVPSDTLTAFLVSPLPSGALDLQPDGSFTYTPTVNFNGVVTFTYRASDTISDSLTATVTITVTAVNDPPVADGDTFTVYEDAPATEFDVLDGDTDVEFDTLTVFSVGPSSQSGSVLNGTTVVTYTPAPDFFGTDTLTYTVSDGNGGFDTAVVTITVTAVNDPPVADAGEDQMVTGGVVTLDGSESSDIEGDSLTYGWGQTGGPTVTLSDASAVAPTFTAPIAQTVLTFTLVVTDEHGLASVVDEVVVTVSPNQIYLPLVLNNMGRVAQSDASEYALIEGVPWAKPLYVVRTALLHSRRQAGF